MEPAPGPGRFTRFIRQAAKEKRLVVQPRMGFGTVEQMRAGLEAVSEVGATTVGTITVDSFTRVNDYSSAQLALKKGEDLNGFPLVTHGAAVTRQMLAGIAGDDFPVQVRHGSALPGELFEGLMAAGVDATEGGPVSYCLPYSRVPLSQAVTAWAECCELLARSREPVHLESFGGCMLGQLCPPSLLIALSVLEGLFFREHGLRDISVSYAQQTHPQQDIEAISALRALAADWLGDTHWHSVLYTYMGVYPRTRRGAYGLLETSARLAAQSGTERLIVKTAAEAIRIPSIAENVHALEFAASVAEQELAAEPAVVPDSGIYEEAQAIIRHTLALGRDVGSALIRAFELGHLDVPFCLHQDNANRCRARIDGRGWLTWVDPGGVPIPRATGIAADRQRLTARGLVDMLSYNERRYDRELASSPARRLS
ncbi:methylaspartate mutase [Amycolatopsis rhabdoformis]|uniref:Methylaspartate mutase n=1 Tax=Amycolatopsis rhabdoformis TaxID=1448059 RepID=A0ABZ1HZH6_9PSEU|nr:methylaspartate mutase [Amycolatopsis rhabdoformis]WSE27365.1 methylaspartate mutase [Amycolatopsis rhabdoformis]